MAYAHDTFINLERQWPAEARRVRYCRGCKYLGSIASWGCCNYFLDTDKRRPNPFGVKNCAVYSRLPNFYMPPSHEDFCRQCDAMEAAKKAEPPKPKKPRRNKGLGKGRRIERRITWDVEYAKILFDRGYFRTDIAKIIGTSPATIKNYVYSSGWKDDRLKQHACKHDIEAARAEYLAYREKHPRKEPKSNDKSINERTVRQAKKNRAKEAWIALEGEE